VLVAIGANNGEFIKAVDPRQNNLKDINPKTPFGELIIVTGSGQANRSWYDALQNATRC
jgi:excinuclease UvrABC ATPase subunit